MRTKRTRRVSMVAALAICAALAACPNDSTQPSDVGVADTGDHGVDLSPVDLSRPDVKNPVDLYPQPDTAPCVPPCVETLPFIFNRPTDVVLDSAGKIYVAESGANRIRVISGGTMSTLAGIGVGLKDGPALSVAQFDHPKGVALDSAGTVHVADTGNHAIRGISSGMVSTLAGDGLPGNTDGQGAAARFNNPRGVALDSTGKIYVADLYNHAIRVIAGGMVTTLAGNGTAGLQDGPLASARFNQPSGVAVDGAGTVYVADEHNHAIRVISGGMVSTLAGDGTGGLQDGQGAAARFNYPTGVAVDSAGTVYVADSDNHAIRKISNGNVTTLAGNGYLGFTDGPLDKARFNQPTGVAVDSNGNIYVADRYNNHIRVIRQQ